MAEEAGAAGLGAFFESWRATFDRISAEVAEAGSAFDEALSDADTEQAHATALAELAGVRGRGTSAIAALADLTHRVETLHAAWRAARRYDTDVLERLASELGARIAGNAVVGAQEWLCRGLRCARCPGVGRRRTARS